MNSRNTKFFLNVVISKFNTVYDYRMFLVKNFGIEDVKNELDDVKFSKCGVEDSGKNYYITAKSERNILNYFEGMTFIQTFNHFIEVKNFKELLLKDGIIRMPIIFPEKLGRISSIDFKWLSLQFLWHY